MIKLLNTKTQKMSAAIMTGAMVGTFGDMGEVFAGNNLDVYLQRTSDKTNSIPDAVAFISYLGGTALAALGIVSLKQHVEQGGQQKPMKDGLAKLGFGGMLLALPTITSVMQETTADAGQAAYDGFDQIQMGN